MVRGLKDHEVVVVRAWGDGRAGAEPAQAAFANAEVFRSMGRRVSCQPEPHRSPDTVCLLPCLGFRCQRGNTTVGGNDDQRRASVLGDSFPLSNHHVAWTLRGDSGFSVRCASICWRYAAAASSDQIGVSASSGGRSSGVMVRKSQIPPKSGAPQAVRRDSVWSLACVALGADPHATRVRSTQQPLRTAIASSVGSLSTFDLGSRVTSVCQC